MLALVGRRRLLGTLAVTLISLAATAYSERYASPAGAPFGPFIAAVVDGRDPVLGVLSTDERAAMEALYVAGRPLWVESSGTLTRNTRDALTILSHAADEGSAQ